MADVIIILIILCIALGIFVYLYRAKKRGETCIGCPYGGQCSQKRDGGCQGEGRKQQ